MADDFTDLETSVEGYTKSTKENVCVIAANIFSMDCCPVTSNHFGQTKQNYDQTRSDPYGDCACRAAN